MLQTDYEYKEMLARCNEKIRILQDELVAVKMIIDDLRQENRQIKGEIKEIRR